MSRVKQALTIRLRNPFVTKRSVVFEAPAYNVGPLKYESNKPISVHDLVPMVLSELFWYEDSGQVLPSDYEIASKIRIIATW